MTTLTINIPDDKLTIIDDISSLVRSVGRNIAVYSDKGSINSQLKAELKQSLNEAFDIIEGKAPKKIPERYSKWVI